MTTRDDILDTLEDIIHDTSDELLAELKTNLETHKATFVQRGKVWPPDSMIANLMVLTRDEYEYRNDSKPKIIKSPVCGGGKTGSLSDELTKEDITRILGFPPNIDDDPYKVTASWGFTVGGVHCGIWDYKGSRWSTSGPKETLTKIFGRFVQ